MPGSTPWCKLFRHHGFHRPRRPNRRDRLHRRHRPGGSPRTGRPRRSARPNRPHRSPGTPRTSRPGRPRRHHHPRRRRGQHHGRHQHRHRPQPALGQPESGRLLSHLKQKAQHGKPVLSLSYASEQTRRGRRPLRPASSGAVGCVVKWYRAAGFGPQGSAAPTNMTQVDQVLASD